MLETLRLYSVKKGKPVGTNSVSTKSGDSLFMLCFCLPCIISITITSTIIPNKFITILAHP